MELGLAAWSLQTIYDLAAKWRVGLRQSISDGENDLSQDKGMN